MPASNPEPWRKTRDSSRSGPLLRGPAGWGLRRLNRLKRRDGDSDISVHLRENVRETAGRPHPPARGPGTEVSTGDTTTYPTDAVTANPVKSFPDPRPKPRPYRQLP